MLLAHAREILKERGMPSKLLEEFDTKVNQLISTDIAPATAISMVMREILSRLDNIEAGMTLVLSSGVSDLIFLTVLESVVDLLELRGWHDYG